MSEIQTPSEMIFWKWCRKLNLLDLEPAIDKQDWDKTLPDFNNLNSPGKSLPIIFGNIYGKNAKLITIPSVVSMIQLPNS